MLQINWSQHPILRNFYRTNDDILTHMLLFCFCFLHLLSGSYDQTTTRKGLRDLWFLLARPLSKWLVHKVSICLIMLQFCIDSLLIDDNLRNCLLLAQTTFAFLFFFCLCFQLTLKVLLGGHDFPNLIAKIFPSIERRKAGKARRKERSLSTLSTHLD